MAGGPSYYVVYAHTKKAVLGKDGHRVVRLCSSVVSDEPIIVVFGFVVLSTESIKTGDIRADLRTSM